jgi:hypothetical protein
MAKRDEDEAKRLLGLLLESAEHEQTAEEAEEELLADGVNLSAFIGRVHDEVRQKQADARLAWRHQARRNADEFAQTEGLFAAYSAMGRTELVAEAKKYAADVHFKNFEEATDDDLRTLLADRARLEALEKKR